MPQVSVVIPAYNAMDYLPQTLANVLQQTLEDIEVIVVNDGSSDGIETWFSHHVKDARVKLYSQMNKGLSGARNAGIQQSQGDYIAFLDADDLWASDKLRKQVHVFNEHPSAGLVYTWVAYIDRQGTPTGRIRKNEAEGMVWPTLIQHNIVECGSVALVRRACFEKVGLFDESLRSLEDLDMWLRLAKYYPFRGIFEPLVYYRQHTDSLSRNWPLMEACFRTVLDRAFASASPEFAHLRPQSYAQAYLCLSWKPIQNRQKDYQEAARLLGKAVSYNPKIQLSGEYWRLSLAIAILQYLGITGYEQLLAMVYRVRRRLSFRSDRTISSGIPSDISMP
ncbi:MAG: glycosyltransferase family 2 protein [Leptolyngbyaceae cyanobacterium]